jgi:hypothetical protein
VDCDFCDDAKLVLGRLSSEFDFVVETLALETAEGRDLAEATGMLFPPGIVIAGRLASHGRPSERRLRRELRRIMDEERRHAARG